jgi:hypothetical protein
MVLGSDAIKDLIIGKNEHALAQLAILYEFLLNGEGISVESRSCDVLEEHLIHFLLLLFLCLIAIGIPKVDGLGLVFDFLLAVAMHHPFLGFTLPMSENSSDEFLIGWVLYSKKMLNLIDIKHF